MASIGKCCCILLLLVSVMADLIGIAWTDVSIDSIAYIEYQMDDYNDGDRLFPPKSTLRRDSVSNRQIQWKIFLAIVGNGDEREAHKNCPEYLSYSIATGIWNRSIFACKYNLFIHEKIRYIIIETDMDERKSTYFLLATLIGLMCSNRVRICSSYALRHTHTRTHSRVEQKSNRFNASNVCSSKWSSMRWVN